MPSKGGRRSDTGDQPRPADAVVQAALDAGSSSSSGGAPGPRRQGGAGGGGPRGLEAAPSPPAELPEGDAGDGSEIDEAGADRPDDQEPSMPEEDPAAETPEWARLYSEAVAGQR